MVGRFAIANKSSKGPDKSGEAESIVGSAIGGFGGPATLFFAAGFAVAAAGGAGLAEAGTWLAAAPGFGAAASILLFEAADWLAAAPSLLPDAPSLLPDAPSLLCDAPNLLCDAATLLSCGPGLLAAVLLADGSPARPISPADVSVWPGAAPKPLAEGLRAMFEARGFAEGSHSEPGHFVIEKAFVER